MNSEAVLAEAQARADANGDGKLTLDDVNELAQDHNLGPEFVQSLKAHAEANGDGKLSPEDVTSSMTDIGGKMSDLKNKFFGQS